MRQGLFVNAGINETMTQHQREWTWRDAGHHGPAIRAFNVVSGLTGFARKRFVPEQLMDKATRKTGLRDFGPTTFREGLDILCRAYSNDRKMTGLGQVVGRELIVSSLTRRLQLIDWHKRHPEAARETIERPLVITGLVRSGTTLGSMLLNLDPRGRSPLVWEVDHPIPPAMMATQHSDPRIAQSQKQLDHFHKLVPPMKAMHPLEACYPQECVVMTMPEFHSIMYESVSLAPEYMEWYSHSDKHAACGIHKLHLQAWQSTVPTDYWTLKAPNHHMLGIDALLDTYPDARVIWCQRDPLVCVASYASLALTFARTHSPHVDPIVAGAYYNEHCAAATRKMIAFDKAQEAQGRRGWCFHLHYEDLVHDPVAAVASAYRHFGEEIDPLHARRVMGWVRQRPKDTFGKHRYSLEDFGLDPRKLRDQYAEYTQRFHIPREYKA